MKVCLVLFSGLPGAGKTSLAVALHRLQQQEVYQMQECKCDTGGRSRQVVDAVLELDAFMDQDRGSNGSSTFTPEAWRKAYTMLREASLQQLNQCLLNEENGVSMRFVFLVDNLPYRSMREAYWKICRELSLGQERIREKISGEHEGSSYVHNDLFSVVGMIEVRVNTPLEVCLERNERRARTPQYIPPYVIRGMSDSFDKGVLAPVRSLDGSACWAMVPCQRAAPWPVLRLVDEETSSLLPSELLAQDLLEQLRSQHVTLELDKQAELFFDSEVRRRENEERKEERQRKQLFVSGELLKSNHNDWLHKTDLRMRAVVGHYMTNLKISDAMRVGIGKRISKCREEHYARAKARFAQLQSDERLVGACETELLLLLQELILAFEWDLSMM